MLNLFVQADSGFRPNPEKAQQYFKVKQKTFV